MYGYDNLFIVCNATISSVRFFFMLQVYFSRQPSLSGGIYTVDEGYIQALYCAGSCFKIFICRIWLTSLCFMWICFPSVFNLQIGWLIHPCEFNLLIWYFEDQVYIQWKWEAVGGPCFSCWKRSFCECG